jgi:hypothetical protein
MADNTDEEHLDNPAKTQSENPSDEIIPTTDTEINISNQEIENMEVHHHPNLHHKPKPWKEYLLEGLMIFIAVTLGFFAESLRENLSNHEKERDFMESMINDLKADTVTISKTIKYYTGTSKAIDTMLTCLKSDNPDPSIISHILSEDFWTYTGYSYNNQTIQELKNSGNFRLIRNKAVVDSILNYDNRINSFVLNQYNDLKSTMLSYKDVEAKVLPYSELKITADNDLYFDSSDFKNVNKHTFITHDRELIALYYNKLFIHELLCHTFINNMNIAKKRATRLISFIEGEYQFE